MRLLQPFWETVRNAPLGPGERRPYNSREQLCAVRFAEETNDMMREILEDRQRYQLTGVRGFIGPLLGPIGLLNEDVRDGMRIWALPSPFLYPFYGRDIVSSFPIPQHLQQYLVGTWEH